MVMLSEQIDALTCTKVAEGVLSRETAGFLSREGNGDLRVVP